MKPRSIYSAAARVRILVGLRECRILNNEIAAAAFGDLIEIGDPSPVCLLVQKVQVECLYFDCYSTYLHFLEGRGKRRWRNSCMGRWNSETITLTLAPTLTQNPCPNSDHNPSPTSGYFQEVADCPFFRYIPVQKWRSIRKCRIFFWLHR